MSGLKKKNHNLISCALPSFPEYYYLYVDHRSSELNLTNHTVCYYQVVDILLGAERELSQRNTNYDKLGENCISLLFLTEGLAAERS